MSTTIVIFGASGDLTWRKLVPALYNNYIKGRMPECTNIVGFARRVYTDEVFRTRLQEGVQKFSPRTFDPARWDEFAAMLLYFQGDLGVPGDYVRLAGYLPAIEQASANRLYYLATSPDFYIPAVTSMGAAGLAQTSNGWRSVVIEKPFGHDLESAQALNQAVHAVFDENQVYRIDHYLGKETAQNILYFRFANTIFEPVWNRRYVDHIQINVSEQVDIGHRGDYYDDVGVVRDMFQNHLLQLLALVAMEPPASFQADAVRNEVYKLLSSIRPVRLEDTVRAQYAGYRAVDGVAPGSQTPTYASLKLYVDNWRWQGVPFYLRSGKALQQKSTEIMIEFQRPPHLMFHLPDASRFTPNMLAVCIQPDEGIQLSFQAKQPDTDQDMHAVDMDFQYRDFFSGELPDAYERLLLDALEQDASLFTRSDCIEAAWRLVDPILQGWGAQGTPPLVSYSPGTWGPPEADTLLARDGRQWHTMCKDG